MNGTRDNQKLKEINKSKFVFINTTMEKINSVSSAYTTCHVKIGVTFKKRLKVWNDVMEKLGQLKQKRKA